MQPILPILELDEIQKSINYVFITHLKTKDTSVPEFCKIKNQFPKDLKIL